MTHSSSLKLMSLYLSSVESNGGAFFSNTHCNLEYGKKVAIEKESCINSPFANTGR